MHSVSLTNNDAAYVLLGKHWKMPTKKEMQELLDKCTWTWKEVKGIKGYIKVKLTEIVYFFQE